MLFKWYKIVYYLIPERLIDSIVQFCLYYMHNIWMALSPRISEISNLSNQLYCLCILSVEDKAF